MTKKIKVTDGHAGGEDVLMREENRRDYLLAVRRLENPRRRWSMQEVKTLLDWFDNRR